MNGRIAGAPRASMIALALALATVLASCGGNDERRGAARPLVGSASTSERVDGGAERAGAEGAHELDRVAVIGASLSAGVAAPAIATTLRGGLGDKADVLDAANLVFFQDPFAHGAAAVEAARAHRPTLVLALDFLFWFAYADLPAEARRARLERGLELLAPLPGTLVLGDLPDMRNANPRILGPAAVPSPDELRDLNVRIRAWAGARPHTLVLPMAEWTRPLVTGADVELAPGERVPASALMFFDGLHPNALGVWHLLDLIDRELERALAVPPDVLRLARPPA